MNMGNTKAIGDVNGVNQQGNFNTPGNTELVNSQAVTDINLLRHDFFEKLYEGKILFNQIISGKFKGEDAEEEWNKTFGKDNKIIVGYKKGNKLQYAEISSVKNLKDLLKDNGINNGNYKRVIGFSIGGDFHLREDWGIHSFRNNLVAGKDKIFQWTGLIALTNFVRALYDSFTAEGDPLTLQSIIVTVVAIGAVLFLVGFVCLIDMVSRKIAQLHYFNGVIKAYAELYKIDWRDLKKQLKNTEQQ